MYEIEVVIFVGVAAAIGGLLLGAGLYRGIGSSASRVRRLKRALEEARDQKQAYQQHVAEHFSETASLLNGLTVQYKKIHDHLATGADNLCRDEQGHSLLAGAPMQMSIEERRGDEESRSRFEEANLRPPLDYAPKTETRSGTLSEEYGLEKVSLPEATDAGNDAADAGTEPDLDGAPAQARLSGT